MIHSAKQAVQILRLFLQFQFIWERTVPRVERLPYNSLCREVFSKYFDILFMSFFLKCIIMLCSTSLLSSHCLIGIQYHLRQVLVISLKWRWFCENCNLTKIWEKQEPGSKAPQGRKRSEPFSEKANVTDILVLKGRLIARRNAATGCKANTQHLRGLICVPHCEDERNGFAQHY